MELELTERVTLSPCTVGSTPSFRASMSPFSTWSASTVKVPLCSVAPPSASSPAVFFRYFSISSETFGLRVRMS